MPSFGKTSRERLDTCDRRLIELMEDVVAVYDCAIITGHRGEAEQMRKYTRGLSQVRWPDGKHNTSPSKAVDAAPWPIDWDDRERFVHFAGAVEFAARKRGLRIRWGGDWDKDGTGLDNNFDDLCHFEIVD